MKNQTKRKKEKKKRALTELVFDEDKVTLHRKKSGRKVNARPVGTPVLVSTLGYGLEAQTVSEKTDKRINAYVASYSHSDMYQRWHYNLQYYQILPRK
ncbi:hypothetical protein KY348_06105 [Candidatus Woesearchaeota archaeon]|nr:hypothetical protein [Candidatus Woesearchaeota archaeon]